MIYSSRATNSYFIYTSVQQVEEFIEGVEISESKSYLFHNFNLLFIQSWIWLTFHLVYYRKQEILFKEGFL